MKIFVILLVFLIAVNSSVGKDSPKAKKAQNEAKAIVNQLKSKGVSGGNKLRTKITGPMNKYLNEMKKVATTIGAEYKKSGVEGQLVGDVFKGNITVYLDTFQKGQFMNTPVLKSLVENALINLRGIVIDPVLGDIQNMTTAINKNSANYNCFKNQKKSIQTIATNLASTVNDYVDAKGKTLKSNITSLVEQIDAYRKQIIGQIKGCDKNANCTTTYFNNTNKDTFNNFTAFGRQATNFILQSTFISVYSFAVNESKKAYTEYEKQTIIIQNCFK